MLPEAGEAGAPEVQPTLYDLHVPPAENVVYNQLVLFDHRGARGVHHVSPCGAAGVAKVNGGQEELLLQACACPDVLL